MSNTMSVATVQDAVAVLDHNPTPLDLINRAVQSNAQVDVMEKLLGLQERWEKNEARKAFDLSISKAKSEIPVIKKGNRVDFTTSRGRTAYSYEDLATISQTVDPILSSHGLSYRWRCSSDDKTVTVTCILSHVSGYSEENSLLAPHDATGNKNAIQAVGSAVTYLQRYTLKAALGLAAAADDDARSVSPENGGHRQSPPPPQRQAPPPAPKPAAPAPPPAPAATPEQKAKLLTMIPGESRDMVREFFEKVGALLPTEGLDDLPLAFIPTTQAQFQALLHAVDAFAAGEEARLPYPKNAAPIRPESAPPAENAPPNVGTEREVADADDPNDPNSPNAPWRSFPMPYGKNAGTPLADLAKNYLFGLWANMKVETEYNGKPKKPETIAKDQEFRRMLDAAGVHYQFTKKD